jgi:hypothetical protein
MVIVEQRFYSKAICAAKKGQGVECALRELSDDEDNMMDTGSDVPDDPQRPWLHDFRAYMDASEQVREGWSAIQWWGVSILVSIS